MADLSIQKKMDELIQKVEISIQQKSAHDSDVTHHLQRQDEMIKILNAKFDDFKDKNAPMLRAFNDSENKKIVWGKFGVEIKNKSLWVMAIGGALGVLWGLLKFGFKLLLK